MHRLIGNGLSYLWVVLSKFGDDSESIKYKFKFGNAYKKTAQSYIKKGWREMMKVILAGYNVDAEIVEKVKRGETVRPEQFSPESVPASYARISRDPRDIPLLREESREEVENARKSNANIIFGMGHKSVGNHAIFNIDILGLSRLAVEYLEARRVGSGYTEKSQRYITLKGDYVVPGEFSEEDKLKFRDVVENEQNKFYMENVDALIQYQFRKNPELAEKARELSEKGVSDKNNGAKNTLEGWGKEDARYSLGLSTQAQVGTSFDATALEHAVRNLKYSELEETRELGRLLFDNVKGIAPSLILYTDPEIFQKSFKGRELRDDNFRDTPKAMRDASKNAFSDLESKVSDAQIDFPAKGDVKLISCDDIDTNVMAAVLHSRSKRPIEDCYAVANYLKSHFDEGFRFMKKVVENVTEFDDPPREFEFAEGLKFEIVLSSSAFAQMKRHRMMTLISQDYDPWLGITIPQSIVETGLADRLNEVCKKSADLYIEFKDRYGKAAEYCLTNAHRRRVLVGINPREMTHFARQRSDSHAQWDIRQISHDMVSLASNTAPLAHMLCCGKDEFAVLREEIYGK